MTKFLSLELFDTMARAGTDEVSLTEIIMSRSNQELKDIGTFYMDCKCCRFSVPVLTGIIKYIYSCKMEILWKFIQDYGHTLASDIESDTVRPYQTLCIQMAEVISSNS